VIWQSKPVEAVVAPDLPRAYAMVARHCQNAGLSARHMIARLLLGQYIFRFVRPAAVRHLAELILQRQLVPDREAVKQAVELLVRDLLNPRPQLR